jgi:hypothetical protein
MRRGKKLRACPMPGCTRTMGDMHFFCWDHWEGLPLAVQEEMLHVWKRDGRHKTTELVQNAIKLLVRRQTRNDAVPVAETEGAS